MARDGGQVGLAAGLAALITGAAFYVQLTAPSPEIPSRAASAPEAGELGYWEIEPGMVIDGPPALYQLFEGGVYRFETAGGEITGVLQPGRVPWRRATIPTASGDSVTLLVSRADLTGDGVLDTFDFLAFQDGFAAGRWWADFNPDPGIRRQFDIFDFLAFQDEFAGVQWSGGTVPLAEVIEWERLG